MASLRARHASECALGGRETTAPKTEREKIDGCTCKPAYSIRGSAGQGYEPVGKNLRVALRALAKRKVDEDAGEYRATENLTFRQWAERWLGSLKRPSPGTVAGYRVTMSYAVQAFGDKQVRRLTPHDVTVMIDLMRDAHVAASTQAKHLRVLGACLRAAVRHGYAGTNPLERLHENERPRAERRESGYFTDAELAALIPQVPEGLWRTLFQLAAMTGMREGELAALTWGDCELQGGTIRVRRTYSGGSLGITKGRTSRSIDLAPETVDMLGSWWGASGKPADEALVFPREDGGGHQPFWRFTRGILYPAMKRASIDRVGPTGEPRNFHSLRHSYARVALERGLPLSWVSRQLGHSSEAVTDKHYGHWSRAASKQ